MQRAYAQLFAALKGVVVKSAQLREELSQTVESPGGSVKFRLFLLHARENSLVLLSGQFLLQRPKHNLDLDISEVQKIFLLLGFRIFLKSGSVG